MDKNNKRQKMMDRIVFLLECLKIAVFDRLVFLASPCVADIPYILYPDMPAVKQEQGTRIDWRQEFG